LAPKVLIAAAGRAIARYRPKTPGDKLPGMLSDRLRYAPLALENLDRFHRLVQDEHVRRYLMDGNLFPREWSEERVRESQSLFGRRGVGLWLVTEAATDELVGFCGFMEIASIHPEPQLIYALFERFSGLGYATEMARASIAHGRGQGFTQLLASVDEVNAASCRVLEKLGFEAVATQQGSFGSMFVLRLALLPI
jgi:ribosomal-protein-alanine N-acetyltransferase